MSFLSRSELSRLAYDAGLSIIGVTSAEPFDELAAYVVEHVRRGHMRGMDWFTEQRGRESTDPRTLHDTARSIISVAVPFWSGPIDPPNDGVLRGRIARYAWGVDYHRVLKRRMSTLVANIESALGHAVEARTLVDTARIVDRAVAARAGAGWYGKNTMIIVPQHGSWVMLGEIILDVQLQPDVPLTQNCGRCSACIDRCPTGAIVEPYRVDAPRCISYLTIEERGPIPRRLRSLMGDYVFGCDLCQDVCPYTRAARQVRDPDFVPRTIDNAFPDLERLAHMSEEEFRSIYSGTPVTRAKRSGLARNAAIALGNSGGEQAAEILKWMLRSHDLPLARGHAAWALRHLLGDRSRTELERARIRESDSYVIEEIDFALAA